MGGFVEGYALSPMSRGAATGATVDVGVSRPLGDNLEIDVETGRGLSGPAQDWFIGVGLAIRPFRRTVRL